VIRYIFSFQPALRPVIEDLVGFYCLSQSLHGLESLTSITLERFITFVKDKGFNYVKNISFVRNLLTKEMSKLEASLKEELKTKSHAMGPVLKVLPRVGTNAAEMIQFMESLANEDNKIWREG
jgi:hypothetical protein